MVSVRAILKILKLHPRGRIFWSEFLFTCEILFCVQSEEHTRSSYLSINVLQSVSAVEYFKLEVILLLLSEH